MTTNMRFLVERLTGAKRSGTAKSKWIARCPAHDDRTASLSIGIGKSGKRLVKCHAGCETEDVLTMVDLKLSDLASTVEDVYDYCSSDDDLIFQVVRLRGEDGRKSFRQRSLDEDGNLRWGREGARLVLYRTPEVREAAQAGRTVYVVEGEKDVHALEALGRVATCNPGGAGKWRDEYAEVLKGAKRVVVITDLDGPAKHYAGERHAQAVAKSLEAAGIRVTIKQPAVGKDVSDHLDAGRTLDKLKEFTAPEGVDDVEITKRPTRFRVLSDEEMLTLPDPEWMIDGLLMVGGFGQLWGKWGVGKSFLAIDWAMHHATGRPWRGREVKQGRPVYVIGEGGLAFKHRIDAWRQRHGVTGATGAVFVPEPVNLMRSEEVEEFLESCLKAMGETPSLFIFDTLNRCMPGGKENSQDDMGKAVANCGFLQRETGAHVLLVHHPGYNQDRGRGSSVLPGALDTIFALESIDDTLLRLRCDKQKDAEQVEPIYLRLTKCGDSLVIAAAEAVSLNRRIYDHVRDHPGCGFNEIRDAVQAKTKTVQKVVEELIEANTVRLEKNGRKHQHFAEPELVVEGRGPEAMITILNVA